MRITAFFAFGLLGLASSSMAQTASSTSSASTTATPSSASASASSSLIPSGISPGCSDFLTSLNSDSSIQACTAPLLSATQYYANATDAQSKKTTSGTVASSADALKNSLGQLCAASTGCQPGVIRTQLSKFWDSCNDELKNKNEAVIEVYDVLYLINPFHEAVCTLDDDNNYCILSTANSTAAKAAATSKRSLLTSDVQLLPINSYGKRQDAADAAAETAETLNSGDISNSNIAYLFLQPDSEKSLLCSSCSKNIMAAYISFETSIPYAIGLGNSDTLKGQSDLYKAMQQTCSKDFTTKVNQRAGTTAFAEVGAAIGFAPARVGVALGAATLLAGLLLA